jgi:hypothetical protein
VVVESSTTSKTYDGSYEPCYDALLVRESVMSRESQCAVLVSVWVLSGIASASADPYSGRYGYDRGGNYPPVYTAPPQPLISVSPAAPRYGNQRGPYAAQPYPYAAQPYLYTAQPYAVPPQPPASPAAPTYVVIAPNAQIYTAPSYGALPSGWVYARPANCGEYRYWDGSECLDARDYPPDLSGN